MIARGFRRLFRLERTGADVDRSVDDEIAFHFDMTIRDLVARGISPADARAEAERRFGNLGDARARMATLDRQRLAHDRRAAWWSAFAQDLHYAIRSLRARPVFAATVIATLGLGIGANAAMFGIVDRLLFRTPHYLVDAGRVHRVFLARMSNGRERITQNLTYRRLLEIDSLTTGVFDKTAGYFIANTAVGSGIESGEQTVFGASATFFELFNAPPAAGRYYGRSEDDLPSGAPVVVLAYSYWQRAYGGRADVVNRTLDIGSGKFTIIGVAPPGLAEEFGDKPPIAFIPITRMALVLFGNESVPDYYKSHSIGWVSLLARRKPGISAEQATAALTTAYQRSYMMELADAPRMAPVDRVKPRGIAAPIVRERGPQASQDTRVATWLEGVAAIVLLIACANVANLLLARAVQRRREIAVRLALGIGRARLFTQLLTESLVLATLGGFAGLAIAQWGGAALRVAFLPRASWAASLFDARTFVFTLAVSLIAGTLSGLAPALYSGRSDLAAALKAGVREGTLHRSRMRVSLLVLQGALSVVLLVGAGLFVRSLLNVRAVHMGYDVDHIVYVSTELRGTPLTPSQSAALKEQQLARVLAIPGVERAARALTVPFWMTINGDFRFEGMDTSAAWRREITRQAGSADFFATMGTRIVRGRGFERTDTRNAERVIVVSEALAKAAWPDKDPLQQCVRMGSDTAPCRRVVGIAENITLGSITQPEGLHYYLPIDQIGEGAGGVFVRVRGRGEAQLENIRRALQAIMPGASYVNVTSLSSIVAPQIKSFRLGATMFVVFGALALGLAAVGLYSVIAYGVTQRQHELGVRVALGARRDQIVSLILRQGMTLGVAGVALGAAAALVAAKSIRPLLFDVSPFDPLVYSGVVGVLLATALAACVLPARRAARVDPNVALRSD
ncbi:MAG TPA: ABC transporter permease [Gemmatimonadaceae bacterium]|nr:ABC transporter permease [Gemmatimonadaceae bacterium]